MNEEDRPLLLLVTLLAVVERMTISVSGAVGLVSDGWMRHMPKLRLRLLLANPRLSEESEQREKHSGVLWEQSSRRCCGSKLQLLQTPPLAPPITLFPFEVATLFVRVPRAHPLLSLSNPLRKPSQDGSHALER